MLKAIDGVLMNHADWDSEPGDMLFFVTRKIADNRSWVLLPEPVPPGQFIKDYMSGGRAPTQMDIDRARKQLRQFMADENVAGVGVMSFTDAWLLEHDTDNRMEVYSLLQQVLDGQVDPSASGKRIRQLHCCQMDGPPVSLIRHRGKAGQQDRRTFLDGVRSEGLMVDFLERLTRDLLTG